MSLKITALSVGQAFGLRRPAITYMRGWGQTIDIPLIMFVIEGADVGPIVVDTGADVDRAEEFHRLRLEQGVGERPDEAVRSLSIDPNDVRIVINTHLHWDHSSHNHLFPNAEVLIQQSELDFARRPVPWQNRQFEVLDGLDAAWLRGAEQIRAVDGDTAVADGVTLVTLPGHTPGSQGVLVEAESTRYLIAGDCVYLYENWEGDAEADHIPAGFYIDLVSYEKSFARIESFDCEVIPSHDPKVIERRVFA
ncbi:MAG TPA: N-acyl homoserine lactonase family protein [Aldersonia sp.]